MQRAHALVPEDSARTFLTIIFSAMAVTFSQGLMIPWMAALETGKMTPLMNSFSTSVTYGGLLVAMLFVGRLARAIGLRSLIIWALSFGAAAIVMFIMIKNPGFWLILRFIFGLSLGAVHFGTQAWTLRLTTAKHRGKQMGLYGLATGVGFAIGPMFLGTGKLAAWLPFVLSEATFLISLLLMLRESSASIISTKVDTNEKSSMTHLLWIAFPALVLPLVFGYMEASLNGDLPLFAHRMHMPFFVISASLAAFVIGSLVFQLPLGHLSDRIGRHAVLTGCSAAGVVLFAVLPLVSRSTFLFIVLSFIAGAFLDTLFSLSLGFLADLVGPQLLPAANQIAVTNLGIGLLIGPLFSGAAMRWVSSGGMFWGIGLFYFLYLLASLIWKYQFRDGPMKHV